MRTDRLLVLEHEGDAGLSLMAPYLPETDVVRPYLGDALPEHLEGYAGLVVLGGSMAAWEDEAAPWLPATRALMAGAVRAGTPLLGICLGAQLLALACGGQVERGAPGLEIGTSPVRARPAGDEFVAAVAGELGATWPVRQYHGDAVIELPSDAELLVTGLTYPNQGFRVGATAWGLQYHPEVSTDLFAAWVAGGVRTGEITTDDAAALLRAAQAGDAAQGRVAAVHARAFLGVVRSRADAGPGADRRA